MSSGLGQARSRLAEARARRAAAEDDIEQTWRDDARRAFRSRILDPLDREDSRAQAAMQRFDEELARAMTALES